MNGIKTFFEALWVFLLFMGCTLIFYCGILWVSEEYNQYHRYDEPKGRSVKVFQLNDAEFANLPVWRLHLFLNHGE
ncbi:YqzK family protein [Evansella tamaricis]|uniref:YqzK family protein n=1 Tax=Evansella tamaricis TaxID=2069301 RepID=A0ABS6JR31_9BACI|nr:YqzK family protein [Evansella tamaricis]MBU9714758.1 YqzK family protein [Evansella tamaricis]